MRRIWIAVAAAVLFGGVVVLLNRGRSPDSPPHPPPGVSPLLTPREIPTFSGLRGDEIVSIPLAGRVVDPIGRSVEGARVSVFRNDVEGEPTLTDRGGAFRFPSVPFAEGTWLYVRDSDYAPARIHVLAADPRDVAIRLTPATSLEGLVIRRVDRGPVSGARIVVSAPKLVPIEARTGEDGRFSVPSVPAHDAFHVFVDAGPDGWTEIPPTRAAPGERLLILLPPTRCVRGRVVRRSADGGFAGVAGVSVVSRVKAWRVLSRGFSDDGIREEGRGAVSAADGTFVLEGITRPGMLTVDSRRWWARPVATPLEEADPSAVIRVVRPDASPDSMARPATVLSGRVLDEQGRPVAGARVEVEQSVLPQRGFDVPWIKVVYSASDGNFRARGVEAGRCTLSVSAFGHERLAPFDIDVGSTDADVGDLSLPELALREGFVIDENGSPIPSATVSLGYRAPEIPVGPAGRFSVGEPCRADYTLRVAAPRRVPRMLIREDLPRTGEWRIVLMPVHVVEALSPEQVDERIAALRRQIIPPRGVEKADVDVVFGEPTVWAKLQGRGATNHYPMHSYQLLPPAPGQRFLPPAPGQRFRAFLFVTYRNDRVHYVGINHICVTKGRPISNDPQHMKRANAELQAENRLVLVDLVEISRKYAGELKNASWSR